MHIWKNTTFDSPLANQQSGISTDVNLIRSLQILLDASYFFESKRDRIIIALNRKALPKLVIEETQRDISMLNEALSAFKMQNNPMMQDFSIKLSFFKQEVIFEI